MNDNQCLSEQQILEVTELVEGRVAPLDAKIEQLKSNEPTPISYHRESKVAPVYPLLSQSLHQRRFKTIAEMLHLRPQPTPIQLIRRQLSKALKDAERSFN